MKIGKKDRKLKFGLNQSILYCNALGVDISDMDDTFNNMANGKGSGSELRALIWSALKDGARVEKSEFNYSLEDVGDWLDDIEADEVANAIKELSATLAKGGGKASKKK